jgi:hypothetical protein
MALYNALRTDAELEKNGVWVEYGQNSNGQPERFLLARAGGANDAFYKTSDRISKPYRRQLQAETLDRHTITRINQEVYAETVVLKWEGVEGEDGEPLQHSKQNCMKLFKDLPDFWQDIYETAQKAVLYRAVVREADAKN